MWFPAYWVTTLVNIIILCVNTQADKRLWSFAEHGSVTSDQIIKSVYKTNSQSINSYTSNCKVPCTHNLEQTLIRNKTDKLTWFYCKPMPLETFVGDLGPANYYSSVPRSELETGNISWTVCKVAKRGHCLCGLPGWEKRSQLTLGGVTHV